MNARACTSILTVGILIFSSLFLSAQGIKEKDLPAIYQQFLDFTRYIMLGKERDVFLQLETNRDRDVFIEAFWKQRDPTPGTPQNEYKEEHQQRFNEANRRFGRTSPQPGWMTDQGRIWIILGQPASIERFEHPQEIYPCQIWSYYGDPQKGLPTQFSLVFFQWGGVGAYRLYNPVADGPHKLLINGNRMETTNYEALYETIWEVAPTLALVSLSFVPGDIPYGYQPSPRANIILANILESPKADINPAYATHFLDYKAMVSTEYMTNYVQSESSLDRIVDPITGLDFVHFSIVPLDISVDFYEPNDQYFCNFTLNVSLRQSEEVIFQYSKEYPIYFSPDDLERIRGNGIAIEDSFPVIPGRYKFIALLQNSVGKQFTVFEREINIPEAQDFPHLNGPFLGYRFQPYRTDLHIPFKVVDKKLVYDPKKTFSKGDEIALMFNAMGISQELWNTGRVRVVIQGLRENDPVQKTYNIRLNNTPYRKPLNVTFSIPMEEISPDYYDIHLVLIDGNGETLDETKDSLIISPLEAVGHPVSHSKSMSLANSFLYYYMLANQAQKVMEWEKSEAYYERGYQMKPDFLRGVAEYADFLIKVKKFDRSLELIEQVKDDHNLQFSYFLTKGKAYMGKENYVEAINNFLEGNKIYNSDTNLLNSMGICFYRTDQKEQALNALKASLKLNPDQPEIKKLVAEIEK